MDGPLKILTIPLVINFEHSPTYFQFKDKYVHEKAKMFTVWWNLNPISITVQEFYFVWSQDTDNIPLAFVIINPPMLSRTPLSL